MFKPGAVGPSLFAANLLQLGEEIRNCENAGVDFFHFDIMDGHFVPNLSLGFALLQQVRACTYLPLDIHLMVEKPHVFYSRLQGLEGSSVSIHVESAIDVVEELSQLKAKGFVAGIAVSPDTPLDGIPAECFTKADFALLMTVRPGLSGQPYLAAAEEKIRSVHARYPQLPLEVDGGIGKEKYHMLRTLGVSAFVMGSAFFKAPDYRLLVEQLRGGEPARSVPGS